jgi:Uma2 family endonuclease
MSSAPTLQSNDPLSEREFDLYEVIDGQRVERLRGAWQIVLANQLAFLINQVAIPNRLGIAVVEALFDFGNPALPQLRPDVAFISVARWPQGRKGPSGNAWRVVPDLVAEVVSPSNTADETHSKVEDYLQAGVKLVWVVHTKRASIHVHDGTSTIGVISRQSGLDGGEILPDFRVSLHDLFEFEPGDD